jgi:hypothetical protein
MSATFAENAICGLPNSTPSKSTIKVTSSDEKFGMSPARNCGMSEIRTDFDGDFRGFEEQQDASHGKDLACVIAEEEKSVSTMTCELKRELTIHVDKTDLFRMVVESGVSYEGSGIL